MTIIQILFFVPLLIYLVALGAVFIGLFNIEKKRKNVPKLKASVVVAARNEEKNIESLILSLLAQTYPIEIIIVNDRSTDKTDEIISKYPEIKQIKIDKCPDGVSPKKYALDKGIRYATGEIILLTDADCVVPPTWVEEMLSFFDEDTGVVSGLSYLNEKKNIYRYLNLELYSLSIVTAGAIGIGFPTISTGNNLAYRKEAFIDVDGFGDLMEIDSGDDDLMIQKIADNTDWRFAFAYTEKSFVQTEPVKSVAEFVSQRSRWASRGLDYSPKIIFFLVSIWILYFAFLLMPLLLFLSFKYFAFLLVYFIIFISMEIFVLYKGLDLFKRKQYLKYYPILKVFHIPYIVIMPIIGIFKGFKWK